MGENIPTVCYHALLLFLSSTDCLHLTIKILFGGVLLEEESKEMADVLSCFFVWYYFIMMPP